MTTDNREKFQEKFQAGKTELERGNYRLSIENLKTAREYISPNSRKGGEAGVWLVSAYQASNKMEEAIALCQELIVHPNLQTREQAQRILYIIKAPKLERPPEWMSEIPDLGNTDQGASRYVRAKKPLPKASNELSEEDFAPLPTDTANNQFVWFAFFLVVVILGSLVWLSQG